MDKEIKQKWIDALRSGEYKQGKGYLKTKNGKFCCLGVLCDVTGQDSYLNDDGLTTFNIGGKGFDTVPPEGFCGLYEQTMRNLWVMNDDDNKTFSEIADYIEKELE